MDPATTFALGHEDALLKVLHALVKGSPCMGIPGRIVPQAQAVT